VERSIRSPGHGRHRLANASPPAGALPRPDWRNWIAGAGLAIALFGSASAALIAPLRRDLSALEKASEARNSIQDAQIARMLTHVEQEPAMMDEAVRRALQQHDAVSNQETKVLQERMNWSIDVRNVRDRNLESLISIMCRSSMASSCRTRPCRLVDRRPAASR